MQKIRAFLSSDVGLLLLLALGRVLLQVFTNARYGFFRDELGTLSNALALAWGFVETPPLTPFLARVAMEIFGPAPNGLRFFSVLAQAGAMVLAGWMARELVLSTEPQGPSGSNIPLARRAMLLAALAVGFSPPSWAFSTLFQYVTFDFLWWVLIAALVIHLLHSENPRWWLAIGAVIGLGVLTRYTIAFFVAGLAVGLLLTPNRCYLKSPWLWGGALLALLISLPHLVWQVQHHFITLDFLSSIHARDIRLGRTDGFLTGQLFFNAVPLLIGLVIAGLYFYFFSPAGRRYRMLGWMFLVPLALLLVFRGRAYYLTPVYPMLVAGGAAFLALRLNLLPALTARWWWRAAWGVLSVGALMVVAITLPLAPPGSRWWDVISGINENLKEEIGWPEYVATVAGVYRSLPDAEKPVTAILAGDAGEAGSLDLYGPAYGMPRVISGFNSYWQRGYAARPPRR